MLLARPGIAGILALTIFLGIFQPEVSSARELSSKQLAAIKKRLSQRNSSKNSSNNSKKKNTNLTGINELYKLAEAAYKEENFPTAYEYFFHVSACKEIKGASSLAAKSHERLLVMENVARDQFDKALKANLLGNFSQALEIIKELLKSYPYTKAAEEASSLLLALQKNPRVAAKAALVIAQDKDASEDYPKALCLYKELMTKYPDSVEALKCKIRIKAMLEDEAIVAALKTQAQTEGEEARPKMLRKANNFLSNGMNSQAQAIFNKIIKKYPDSEEAKEAREKLAEIKKKTGK
jgi:tetratricopeptide (TPR) repeat protein